MCCNPTHLWLGNNSSNQLDSSAKGRHSNNLPPPKIGEEHHSSKLTAVQVREIRAIYERGEMKGPQLGLKYGVAQTMISKIITRKSWKHVT